MDRGVIARNNVRVSGHGEPAMLFAHGFGCDQNMWRFVAPAFEDSHRVVLFDYVGSGRSDHTAFDLARYGTLEGYAQDVLDVCEALDLHGAIFVGHSVSAMIGMLAAQREPERFSGLAMIGPSPCYINDEGYVGGFERSEIDGLLQTMEKNYIGWASFLAPVIMKNPDRPELAAELQDSFCSTDPVFAQHFARAVFLSDNRADLGPLGMPVLLMQCAEDIIAPDSVGHYLHDRIPGSTLARMKATGHCPHMSHPEETVSILKSWMNE